MPGIEKTTYRHVQGLSRGLDVLRALNCTAGGRSTIRQLGDDTGLHRTTVRRLLETLATEGYVQCSPSDGSYSVALRVRDLSEGFTDQEWIAAVATTAMGQLLKEVQWPSDLTTLDGSSMRIRESTHRFSSLSFARAMVGRRMPLLFSASGRAYLASCGAQELKELTRLMIADGDRQASCARDPVLLRNTLENVRHNGYASNEGDWQPDSPTGAIALPIRHAGKTLGCMNLIYLRRAMTLQQAVTAYLRPLADAVQAIETRLDTVGRGVLRPGINDLRLGFSAG